MSPYLLLVAGLLVGSGAAWLLVNASWRRAHDALTFRAASYAEGLMRLRKHADYQVAWTAERSLSGAILDECS